MKLSNFKIFSILSLSLSLLACGEEHDFLANSAELAVGARVKFVHAAPDVAGVTWFVNDKLVSGVNTAAPAAPGLLSYGSVFPANQYTVLPAGNLKVRVTAPATATTPEATLSTDLSTQENKNYTVYAIGVAPTYEFLTTEDDLNVPEQNKTYVRFINAMSKLPAAGIEFLVDNKVVASFKEKSDGKEQFISFDQAGPARFTLVMREIGTTTALGTLSAQNWLPSKKYTVIARGAAGAAAMAARPAAGFFANN